MPTCPCTSPARHNISNALAAASAAYVLGIPGEAVTAGLAVLHRRRPPL